MDSSRLFRRALASRFVHLVAIGAAPSLGLIACGGDVVTTSSATSTGTSASSSGGGQGGAGGQRAGRRRWAGRQHAGCAGQGVHPARRDRSQRLPFGGRRGAQAPEQHLRAAAVGAERAGARPGDEPVLLHDLPPPIRARAAWGGRSSSRRARCTRRRRPALRGRRARPRRPRSRALGRGSRCARERLDQRRLARARVGGFVRAVRARAARRRGAFAPRGGRAPRLARRDPPRAPLLRPRRRLRGRADRAVGVPLRRRGRGELRISRSSRPTRRARVHRRDARRGAEPPSSSARRRIRRSAPRWRSSPRTSAPRRARVAHGRVGRGDGRRAGA